MKTAQQYGITTYDDQPNGLAGILTTLLGQNLEQHPERRKIARSIPRPVAVHSTDTQQTATIVFHQDRAEVYNDLVGRPSVLVKASVAQVMDVSQLRMRARGFVPLGFFTRRGLRVLGQILTGKLVVRGLLTHTATALKFIALISIAG